MSEDDLLFRRVLACVAAPALALLAFICGYNTGVAQKRAQTEDAAVAEELRALPEPPEPEDPDFGVPKNYTVEI